MNRGCGEGFLKGFCSASNEERPTACPITEALESLPAAESRSFYPPGFTLFAEGAAAAGIFILRAGRVKLSISEGSDAVQVRIAKPGEVLGLSAVLSCHPHEMTAETITPCHLGFVWREDCLRLLRQDSTAAFRVVQWLGYSLEPALEQIRLLHEQHSRRLGRLGALLLAVLSWFSPVAS